MIERGAIITMMRRLGDHFPHRVAEWLAAGMLLSWGFSTLGAPPEAWAAPINNLLARWAGQYAWAMFAIAVGLARLVALFINGALRRSPHTRAIGAFLAMLVWTQLTLGAMALEWTAPAASFFPWLLLADLYNVARAARDARSSDTRARHHDRLAVPDAPAS